MKILITGAAGFIGSNLTAALLKRGDTVIGLDNMHRDWTYIDDFPNRFASLPDQGPGQCFILVEQVIDLFDGQLQSGRATTDQVFFR